MLRCSRATRCCRDAIAWCSPPARISAGSASPCRIRHSSIRSSSTLALPTQPRTIMCRFSYRPGAIRHTAGVDRPQMEAYALDWLQLILRWIHLITGIAWIGASFYFVWLDNSLRPPQDPADTDKGVGGELWAVHGGGFYVVRKFRIAPETLPATLHWFKWEAYWTWISGFALLVIMYYLQAQVYLIDKSVAALTPVQAIGISVALIVVGWLV